MDFENIGTKPRKKDVVKGKRWKCSDRREGGAFDKRGAFYMSVRLIFFLGGMWVASMKKCTIMIVYIHHIINYVLT